MTDTSIVRSDTGTPGNAAPSMNVDEPIEIIFSTRLPGAYQEIMMRVTTSWLMQDPSYTRLTPEERANHILDRGFETFWQTAQRMGADIYHDTVKMEFAGKSWTYRPPSRVFRQPDRRNAEAAAYLAAITGWNQSQSQKAADRNVTRSLPVLARPAQDISQQEWMSAQVRPGQGR